MSVGYWIWRDDTANWIYFDINIDRAPAGAVIHHPKDPDWAPPEWLAEHPGWERVWHEQAWYDHGHLGWDHSGHYVWQPPTPEPPPGAGPGHYEWHWIDEGGEYSPGWGDGHWEWLWIDDQP